LKGTAKIFNQPFKYKPTAKIGYLKLTKGSWTIFNPSKKGENEKTKRNLISQIN
jgi:hypothetical protein